MHSESASSGENEAKRRRVVRDCRYGRADDTARPGGHGEAFPADDLFRPPLADMKEPRFYASLRRVDFHRSTIVQYLETDRINAGVVALGGNVGIWTWRQHNGCDGFQIGLNAGAFSQFNLSAASEDLLNTDFIAGIPMTARSGHWSGRLWIYHQSSHLGDEFVLNNPDIDRLNLSFEVAQLTLSYGRDFWRLYGGAGLVLNRTIDIDRWLLIWGGELRGLSTTLHAERALTSTFVLGATFTSIQARNFRVTSSIKGGWEVSNAAGHRARFLAVVLDGFMPFGQFFNREEVTNYGVELQLEL